MKRSQSARVLLLLLSLSFTPFVLAVAPVQVALELHEEKVLPGTPTGFTLRFTNLDVESVALPGSLWMVAATPDGERIRLRHLGNGDGDPFPVPASLAVLAPGESRVLRVDPPATVDSTLWLLDERVVMPGEYVLRVVAADEVDRGGRFDANLSFISNSEVLIVEHPTGPDAAVWKWMQERARGPWGRKAWSNYPGELAEFVFSAHPDSKYALYTAIWLPGRDLESQDDIIERMTRRYSDDSYTDSLRLALALRYEQQFQATSSVERKAALLTKLREVAAELSEESRSDNVTRHAKKLLEKVPTMEKHLDRAAEQE